MVSRLPVASSLVIGLAFAPAVGQTADTVVATVPAVRHLSAYRGVTAWSYAVGDPRAGVFRVAYRRGRITRTLPRSFRDPEVDPDLGPSRDGHSVVLVVSRCGLDGCAVESTNTRNGKTVRVQGLGRLHCAGLISPSTWRGTIVVIGDRCGRKDVDGLYVRDRGGRVRRLIGLASTSAGETDLARGYAAVSERGDNALRIVALGTGRSRIVWQGDFSASFDDYPGSPALDGGVLFWLETDGAVDRQTRRWLDSAPAKVQQGKTCQRRQLAGTVGAIAVTNRQLLYATADAVMRRGRLGLSCAPAPARRWSSG